jgi:AcrR family transcriptional regulator
MGDLRTRLLDAALVVVGQRGVPALTHHAVDLAAGTTPGSAAECFPTRAALLEAVADRCIEREQEMVTGAVAGGGVDATPGGLARAFGRFVARAVGPDRDVTLARYALQVAVAQDSSLRPVLAAGADRVDTWAVDAVRRAGSLQPERDFGILANYATGLVFHELALPSRELDATSRIRALIETFGWTADG